MNDFPILLPVYRNKLAAWKSRKVRESDREEKMATLFRLSILLRFPSDTLLDVIFLTVIFYVCSCNDD